MDNASVLQSFGLSLPGPAYLVGMILFGLVGIAAYRYGKQAGRPVTRWLGVGLMFYPYAVAQTWLLYLVGALLCAGLFFDPARP